MMKVVNAPLPVFAPAMYPTTLLCQRWKSLRLIQMSLLMACTCIGSITARVNIAVLGGTCTSNNNKRYMPRLPNDNNSYRASQCQVFIQGNVFAAQQDLMEGKNEAMETKSRTSAFWKVHSHRASPTSVDTISLIRGGGEGQDGTSTSAKNSFTFVSNSVNLPSKSILYETVVITLQILTTTLRTILPPIVTLVGAIVNIYRVLPVDAIMAQIGLVYAFAGGYYPTLFAAVQAAQQCGSQEMITAVQIIIQEATAAIRACNFPSIKMQSSCSSSSSSSFKFNRQRARDILTEKIKIVLATIDPVRINEAVAALYTTWFSISIVLEREFARTITLSISIAESIRPIVFFIINRPLQLCISTNYHKWIPIVIGWVCKATAMSLAWRIQRVLTAYTSAIAGGLMCSRAVFRMIRKRGIRFFGLLPQQNTSQSKPDTTGSTDTTMHDTHLDEFLGYMIALCGLYSQIGHGFGFEIPFPLNLVTWPFDLAERWIQWQITKKSSTEV
jgi:hypothetical protein